MNQSSDAKMQEWVIGRLGIYSIVSFGVSQRGFISEHPTPRRHKPMKIDGKCDRRVRQVVFALKLNRDLSKLLVIIKRIK